MSVRFFFCCFFLTYWQQHLLEHHHWSDLSLTSYNAGVAAEWATDKTPKLCRAQSFADNALEKDGRVNFHRPAFWTSPASLSHSPNSSPEQLSHICPVTDWEWIPVTKKNDLEIAKLCTELNKTCKKRTGWRSHFLLFPLMVIFRTSRLPKKSWQQIRTKVF